MNSKYAGQTILVVFAATAAMHLAGPEGLETKFYPTPDRGLLTTLLTDGDTHWQDRALAEDAPAWLQPIPYMVLRGPDGRLLTYSRGKKGAEDRLHAKRSFGFGGHVDMPIGGSPDHLGAFDATCKFELVDETGVTLADDADLKLQGFLFDNDADVGRVHLGVLFLVDVTEKQIADMVFDEEDGITDPVWMTRDEMLALGDTLEKWSAIALDHIAVTA